MTYPFEARGETSTTSAAEAGSLDFADDPVVALENDLLRLVPVAHLLRALEIGGVSSVEILENAVLVAETTVDTLRGAILDGRQAPHGGP